MEKVERPGREAARAGAGVPMTNALREEAARVRAWYDLVADAFASRYADRLGWYFERCEEDLLHSALPLKGKDVLDLGTGSGRLVPRLAKVAKSVAAVDISEALLRHAPHVAGASFAQMNALDLGFRDRSFDAVVSLGLFEYVEDFGPFLDEIRRVLRPGGRIAFTYHQIAPFSHVEAEPPEAQYFGRTVGERSQYWSKRRHRGADVMRALAAHGFRVPRRHRVFFRVPQKLYSWSCRMTPESAGDRLLRGAALASDRLLGRALRSITQFSTGNVLIIAEAAYAAKETQQA
jgi:ubiquinone/menaquinone biosynthesis C-methylase UbiE